MSPVYAPGPCYPTVWERIARFGRKNSKGGKPQQPRKIKGRTRPPHKGGKNAKGSKGDGKSGGGWFS